VDEWTIGAEEQEPNSLLVRSTHGNCSLAVRLSSVCEGIASDRETFDYKLPSVAPMASPCT
jgi:hypothetical protein